MDLGLSGKRALVTGASRGLGLAIARELALEGAAVAMVARGADTLARAAADVAALARDAGGGSRHDTTHALVGDVGVEGDAARLVAAATAAMGGVDILVANAGGPPSTTFATTSEAQYRAALETNLLGSIRLAQASVPAMRERRWGRVIFLTSMSAKQPLPGLLLSNTARAGLLGFAKTLATECAPDGVLVNTVLPGHFDTDRAMELARMRAEREGRPVEELLAARTRAIPAGRSGDPREFAAVVAFLASERASFLTGTAIQVDGGQVSSLF